MRTRREQVATQYRSQGKAAAEALRADTDAQVIIQIAEAKAKAQKVRAQGDSKAAMVYAAAYKQDPSFYAFYRSLDAYQSVFHDKNDIMVLKPDSQFFKYFNMNKLVVPNHS